MALGFGPGSEMIKAVNKNRSNRNKRSLKESSDGTISGANAEVGLKFKNSATPAELDQIRSEMEAQNKKKLYTSIIVTGVVLISLALLVFSN